MPSEPRYCYHYCAEFLTPNEAKRVDGIALMRQEITSMESYSILKSTIVNTFKLPIQPDKLSVISLTPLGLETPAPDPVVELQTND